MKVFRQVQHKIELPMADRRRLAALVADEVTYFNSLLAAFAGPIRTMGDTIRSITGEHEHLFATLSSLGLRVSELKREALPGALKEFAKIIFPDGGMSPKMALLMDIPATVKTALCPSARRAIALRVLMQARNETDPLSGDTYKFGVATQPIDPRRHRHVQIPIKDLKITKEDGGQAILTPYFSTPVRTPETIPGWNCLIVRLADDGVYVEFVNHAGGLFDHKRSDTVRNLTRKGTAYPLRKRSVWHVKP